MPYPPVLNPMYFHLEPWPHVYRRGGWIRNVTGEQQSPAVRPMLIIPHTALGAAAEPTSSPVPWQCWDMPGFKTCQTGCFTKAQATNLSAEAQGALIDQCVITDCVAPCKSKLAAQGEAVKPSTNTSSLSTPSSFLDKITASPLTIAVAALALAAGSMLLMPPAPKKRRAR